VSFPSYNALSSHLSHITIHNAVSEISEMTDILKSVQMDMAVVKEATPMMVQQHDLTPSLASQHQDETDDLLHKLNLNNVPEADNNGDKFHLPEDSDFARAKEFSWKWKTDTKSSSSSSSSSSSISTNNSSSVKPGQTEKSEEESYAPLLQHISDLGLVCVNIANGQRLGKNQLLFNTKIFTLRREGSMMEHGQTVTYIRRVKGRTDLVVLDSAVPGDIMINHVHVAIEVKTQTAMASSTSGCLREAVVQVIGLNANNNIRSPAVLLTNLLKIHKVVYLKQASVSPLKYELRVRRCVSFNAALHFALTMGKEFDSTSEQFARPMTPIDE